MARANAAHMQVSTGPPDSEEHARATTLTTMFRLKRFIRLRWVFFATAVAVLVLERFVLVDVERPFGLAVVLFALAATNLTWMALARFTFRGLDESGRYPAARLYRVGVFANAQVAVDLLLLTCILGYTGGAENPMAMFYLFHMAIVPLLLKHWQAILQGTWALLAYAVLLICEWQHVWPHYTFLPCCQANFHDRPMFVIGAIVVVACGIFGTLYFTLNAAKRLDARERQLRQVNAALRRSQTAIRDLQRRRSRFMQVAAHQLKSPLAVIQTLADLIRCNVVPSEAVAGTCDKIVRRCREGIEQVGELLTLARVQEADPARHGQSEADVRAVISALCNHFGPLAKEKNIELICRMPEAGELRISVDQDDLSDCLSNLIENAIKYTPGPGKVAVTVTTDPPKGPPQIVSIKITDTGMGIPPEILTAPDGEPGHEPIFDAFRRGNNAIAAGISGTGLGLSIVREVVEQAGGRIRVTSSVQKGSSFTVTFPAHRRFPGQPRIRDTRASEIVLEPTQRQGARRPSANANGSP